ncbi:MAG: glutathione S-transferase [Pseudomonadota bacterium]
MSDHPILWTFRRCPYAMRARLAVLSAGQSVELREILLRDKPDAFLTTSPSATVPALRLGQTVIDESLDIMVWALKENDPERLLDMPEEGWDVIAANDGPFKQALDRTKYATRYPDHDPATQRRKAATHLLELEALLDQTGWLFKPHPTLADYAVLPFVRQFAHIDRAWFDAQDWPNLIAWLDQFLTSGAFQRIMVKYKPWSGNDPPVWFGAAP